MRDYSLDDKIDFDNEDDDWYKEPEEVVEIGDLRLDPDAAKRYLEVRKARELKERGLPEERN